MIGESSGIGPQEGWVPELRLKRNVRPARAMRSYCVRESLGEGVAESVMVPPCVVVVSGQRRVDAATVIHRSERVEVVVAPSYWTE